GLGHPARLAVVPHRDGRQLLRTAGEEIAVSFLEVVILAWGESLPFALGHSHAGLLQQVFHVLGPGVAVGLNEKSDFAQQMGSIEPVTTVVMTEWTPSSRG
ncbi:MAG: hypothetical protein ACYDEV_11745, partial [Acidiferrobacter sp.]